MYQAVNVKKVNPSREDSKMASCCDEGCATSTEKYSSEGRLLEELDYLSSSVQGLSETLGFLEHRLVPVLEPTGQSVSDVGNPPSGVPVLGSLERIRAEVNSLTDRVRFLLETLVV